MYFPRPNESINSQPCAVTLMFLTRRKLCSLENGWRRVSSVVPCITIVLASSWMSWPNLHCNLGLWVLDWLVLVGAAARSHWSKKRTFQISLIRCIHTTQSSASQAKNSGSRTTSTGTSSQPCHPQAPASSTPSTIHSGTCEINLKFRQEIFIRILNPEEKLKRQKFCDILNIYQCMK